MHETPSAGPVGRSTRLAPVLGAWQLWGLAVGLVISGEYFGWSYGWAHAGTLGFLVTTLVVAVMYTSFIFSFTELTTAIPDAGGPFAYACRAFGPLGGAIAGWATIVEFVFAPPAIALAIGTYLCVQFPRLDPQWTAVAAYGVFMALNILGVTLAATPFAVWFFHAIVATGLAGIAAIFSDSLVVLGDQPLTAAIVTMAVLGAMVMYGMTMASLFALRLQEPTLQRPFPAIGYPWVPALALLLVTCCLGTVVWSNPGLGFSFGVLLAVAAVGSWHWRRRVSS